MMIRPQALMVSLLPFLKLEKRSVKRKSWSYVRSFFFFFFFKRSLRGASMKLLFLLSPRKSVLWILRTSILLLWVGFIKSYLRY
jgi:hypothetical protein